MGSDSNQLSSISPADFRKSWSAAWRLSACHNLSADCREFAEFAHSLTEAAKIGRRNEQNAAEYFNYAADLGLIGGIAGRILGAEFRDLALGAALSGEQITPIRQRQKILSATLDEAQPALMQLQVLYDLGLQQAHSIGGS